MPDSVPLNADAFDYEAALEACARGERFALNALYRQEARRLLGVAQRIVGDRDSAHDVLQDAFVQIWQRAASYQRALGSGRGWIYTVVRHKALDTVRRAGREVSVGDDLNALSDAHQARQDDPTSGHDAAALSHCLDALDERRRECIVYAFVEGYTHDQIATKLSTPVGTVKSWIRRGLQALKECLS